jgi:uncharacterized membrane protein YeaQ/YmgE (transglycosylase-associated protein family)
MTLATSAVFAPTLGSISLDPGGIFLWIVAGLIAGWLAGHVVRGRGFGCLGDILLGVIGAFVGEFALSLLPLSVSGTFGFWGTLVVAFLGALLLAAIGRLIGGGNRAARSARYTRYTDYEWPGSRRY